MCIPIKFDKLKIKIRSLLLEESFINTRLTYVEQKIVDTCNVLRYICDMGSLCSISEKWFSSCSPYCICNTTRQK